MDWGVITAVVAALFAALGLILGLFMAKVLFPPKEPEPEFKEVEERVDKLIGELHGTLESLKEKMVSLREEEVEQIEEEVKRLQDMLKSLKAELVELPLSPSSLEALDKTEAMFEGLNFDLPTVDEKILTQIRDNLIILRNDLQTLIQLEKQKEKEGKEPAPLPVNLEEIKTTVESALELSRRLNAGLVKGELLTLIEALKTDAGKELLKDIDDLALSSKELVLLLEGLRKNVKAEVK